VLGGSETYLPHLALDISLLLYFGIFCELLQLEGSRGRISPWIWWEENWMVHNELVRILEQEHNLIGA